MSMLEGGSEHSLTLLVAPAGFGKTTLLTDFVARTSLPVAWLTLTEWDRDPETLAEHLFVILKPMFVSPRAGPAAFRHVTPRSWARAVAGSIADGLSDQPLAIVLDDYQVVEGEGACRMLIEALLSRLPRHARVLIGSRIVPGLTVLPRLLARNEAVVIDSNLLKFTREEVAELIRQSGDTMEPGRAEELWNFTGGWPAPLRIAIRSSMQWADVGPGSPTAMLAALIDDVLGRLKAERRRTLLALSVFDDLSDEICALLPGGSLPGGLRRWFQESGLPVSGSNDLDRPTYRLHPLLREHLLRRLRLSRRAYLAAEGAAGNAFLGLGQEVQALAHFIKAGAQTTVQEMTPRVISRLLSSGRWATAVQLLSSMPSAWLDEHADLQIWRARALFWSGDSDAALEAVARTLRGDVGEQTRVEALTLRAGALRKKGDYSAARAACYEALQLADERQVPPPVAFEARREFGFTLIMQGDLPLAREQLSTCLTYFEVQQDRENAARVRDGLGSIEGQLGNLPLAAVHLRRALTYWERLDNPAAASNTLNNLGMVVHQRGEPDEAARFFERALDDARRGGNRHIEGFVQCSLGDLDLDFGRFDAAAERFQSSLLIARALDSSTIASYALGGLGRAYLGQGQYQKAENMLAEATADARLRSGRSELARLLVWLARSQVAQARLREAESHLCEAVEIAEAGELAEDGARARLWLAEVHLRRGDRALALDEIGRIHEPPSGTAGWNQFDKEAKLLPAVVALGASQLSPDSALASLLRAATVPVTPAPSAPVDVDVSLLGEVQLTLGGTPVDVAWRTRRVRELFAYLVVNPRAARSDVCLALWPDHSPETAGTALRVTLHRLRKAIRPLRVESRGGRYVLTGYSTISCDAVRFEALISRARRLSVEEERLALFQQATALYQGPLAVELRSEWASQLRNSLEGMYVAALSEIAEHSASAGEYEDAACRYEIILEIEPFNDSAALQLMFCRAAQGQRTAASHLFRSYARRLQQEGLEPSPSVVSFYEQLLNA